MVSISLRIMHICPVNYNNSQNFGNEMVLCVSGTDLSPNCFCCSFRVGGIYIFGLELYIVGVGIDFFLSLYVYGIAIGIFRCVLPTALHIIKTGYFNYCY